MENDYEVKTVLEDDSSNQSEQVRELCEHIPKYGRLYRKLFDATADNPGPTVLAARGYGYLVQLFYGMRARTAKSGKAMSQKFFDICYFARYVGPRPSTLYSLDRINNNQGYGPGNVQWATRKQQSENRRSTRKHQYMGRNHSDSEIALILVKAGATATEGSIKKQRQRLQKRNISAGQITAEIFRYHKIPYEKTGDCVKDWDFRDGRFHPEVEKSLVATFGYLAQRNETKLAYAVRYFKYEGQRLMRAMNRPTWGLTNDPNDEEIQNLYLMYFRAAGKLEHIESGLRHQRQLAIIERTPLPFIDDL